MSSSAIGPRERVWKELTWVQGCCSTRQYENSGHKCSCIIVPPHTGVKIMGTSTFVTFMSLFCQTRVWKQSTQRSTYSCISVGLREQYDNSCAILFLETLPANTVYTSTIVTCHCSSIHTVWKHSVEVQLGHYLAIETHMRSLFSICGQCSHAIFILNRI